MAAESYPIAWRPLGGAFPLLQAQCGSGSSDQVLEMRLTVGISGWHGAYGSIRGQGLLLPTEFGVEVAASQLKKGVCRIFLNERGDDTECLFVLLIVAMQVQREIEASDIRRDDALRHGVFELAHPVLFGAAGNTHEKAQDSGYGT